MAASKAQRAKTAARRARAINLRLAGVDWQSIADQLGYADKAAACKDVTRALEANTAAARAAGEDLRELELARLDRMLAGLWPKASRGDTRAVDSVLRLMQRRARLLGLDETWKGDATEEAVSLLGALGVALGIGSDVGHQDEEEAGAG